MLSDDFTSLNEKFIKARRDYESLLEASMSHPPQPTYGRPAYTYGAPPAQQAPYGGQYGNQPPQSQDQRYYSPGPSEQQQQQYPPSNGPQPFYFVPQSQQGQGQSQTPALNQNSSTDDLYSGPSAKTNMAVRPASIAFDPRVGGGPSGGPASGGVSHELATSAYDSPVDSRTGYAHPPPSQQPPQQPQLHQSTQAYDGYAAPGSQRPVSPPAYTKPVIPQQQKPQSAIYTLPSQQPQRLPSGGQQPSDPYNSYSQGAPQVGGPQSPPLQASTSPVQVQHQAPQQLGYPAHSLGQQQQQQPSAPPGGYQSYQAYHPGPGQPPAGAAAGHAPVAPAGGREDEGFYR